MKYILLFTSLLCFACHHHTTEVLEPRNKEKPLTNEEILAAISNEEKIKVDSIGILVYDGFFDLDAVGPFSVLSNMIGTKVFFISENKGEVTTSSGLKFAVSHSIDEIDRLDILLIPGGTKGTLEASKNEKLINWIKSIDKTTKFTTSVCTGAWLLGEAGLLEGKKATTNWYRAEEKLESYGAHFVENRYVQDGKIWTSAGVSAGIDMSLALVKEIKGETYTRLVMLNLEYDPSPPLVGGSVKNTNEGLVEYMTKMYDGILESK